jgi:hypothetical protein
MKNKRDPKAREIIHFLDEMEATKAMIQRLGVDILESHIHDIDMEIEITTKANLSEIVKNIFNTRLDKFKKLFQEEIERRNLNHD